MKISKWIRIPTTFLMVFLLTDIFAFAASVGPPVTSDSSEINIMLSTSSVVADLTRYQTEQKIHEFIGIPKVQAELVKQGVAPIEVTNRLASLNVNEIRQLSLQIEKAQYGGDILLTVLLILLIIFFAKRI